MEKGKRIIATVINDLTYDRRMQRICSALAGAGWKVTLVGRKLPESERLEEKSFQQKRLRLLFRTGALFYAEYNIRLFFFLLFAKTDIICAVDADTLLPGYLVSVIRRKKLVFDAHEWFSEVPELLGRPRVRKIWQKIEHGIIPKVRYAYTVGPMLAEKFTKMYGVPFHTIMNAPPLQPVFAGPEHREPNTIIYQGALNKGRGIEHMIMAMHRVNGKFIIVGEGDLSASLRRLVSEQGLNDKVHFAGFVKPVELSAYTNRAWVGLNVSEAMGNSYIYSLNNKFFDYIHAGLPALTNKLPEYEQLNERYGVALLADPDPADLAEKCNRLFEDRDLWERLHRSCQAAAQELNWQKESVKLLEFYYKIGN